MTGSSAERTGRVRRSSGELAGLVLQPGQARGRVLRLDRPLSFWGGTSLDGMIIDRQHPQYGQSLVGRVLAMTSGRGSSSSSSVLAEQVRSGCGPAAVLMAEPDAIVALGAIVAAELYAIRVPVLVITPADFASLSSGEDVSVTAPGGMLAPE
ncbi:MAG: aconitase X swivel domain-containing protein [Propionibacteriaceae bacterium]